MSAPIAVLARKVFDEYSRAGGNPPEAHFDRNAAEQWMAHALEFAGVAELIDAAEETVEDHDCGAVWGCQIEKLRAAVARAKGGAA